MTPKKPIAEDVVREFPPIGKYRVRLVKSQKGVVSLDVREYVAGETFEGFTRRGIRISDRAQVDLLRDVCKDALEDPQWKT